MLVLTATVCIAALTLAMVLAAVAIEFSGWIDANGDGPLAILAWFVGLFGSLGAWGAALACLCFGAATGSLWYSLAKLHRVARH